VRQREQRFTLQQQERKEFDALYKAVAQRAETAEAALRGMTEARDAYATGFSTEARHHATFARQAGEAEQQLKEHTSLLRECREALQRLLDADHPLLAKFPTEPKEGGAS